MLLEELPRAGLSSILPADGAFYLYADISRFTGDSEAFAKTMLKDIGVAVTPGIDFDPDRGRNYIRFCYAGAEGADAGGSAPHHRLAEREIGSARLARFLDL
jgi:aspartate/methionine/tyrosine aminotransferase